MMEKNLDTTLVVGIFLILDRINPEFDTKQVWNNLKKKSSDELNEIYSELVTAEQNLANLKRRANEKD